MAEVEFKDFTIQVKGVMEELAEQVLEEVAGEIESETKRNTRVALVGGGNTKNNWRHSVQTSSDQITATVGNPLENAIWEEFGTGEYALNGDGRKGGWSYQDDEGKWHHTHGKTPSRALHKAYTKLKNKMIRHIQDTFKGGMK